MSTLPPHLYHICLLKQVKSCKTFVPVVNHSTWIWLYWSSRIYFVLKKFKLIMLISRTPCIYVYATNILKTLSLWPSWCFRLGIGNLQTLVSYNCTSKNLPGGITCELKFVFVSNPSAFILKPSWFSSLYFCWRCPPQSLLVQPISCHIHPDNVDHS